MGVVRVGVTMRVGVVELELIVSFDVRTAPLVADAVEMVEPSIPVELEDESCVAPEATVVLVSPVADCNVVVVAVLGVVPVLVLILLVVPVL